MVDRLKKCLGSFIHNCIAHPAMFFLPEKYGTAFHDWTAEKAWPPKYTVTWDSKTDTIMLNGVKKGRGE